VTFLGHEGTCMFDLCFLQPSFAAMRVVTCLTSLNHHMLNVAPIRSCWRHKKASNVHSLLLK